ncbi:proteasome subunit beta [Streptomyces sp. DSM 15324]|uniref:Proteasome subunit beta n=1 Tax=Streptomyces cinnabarigriseus TaxID=319633 RepID=F0V3Y7_9ACTN|nr:proteasome subunit beta [Streptomyces sp. DSM 15324]AFI56378.1 20S proteasome beta-subunit [Streptomyces cinnabarigriseus]KUO12360.1 proteasome subunit beta [Streptomyces sp. DSM 15324]CBW54670.1 20S proteasome beta-subunit [Streptomyces cinnabarigriseus]
MARGEGMGGPVADLFAAGSSSFIDFLQAHRPEMLGTSGLLPEGVRAAPDQVPHGTTVLALVYRDGVLIAGDRRATMGHMISQRDLEKVHPADDHTALAFAGSVGLALDLVKLYQVELTHFEKIEGIPMTLNAKATRLGHLVRQNLGQAMQGLAVVPLLAGYDPETGKGRVFGYDITGGRFEREDFHAEGSGSVFARGALKKLYRPEMSRRDAALTALQSLYDAADDDSATGGPDLSRRIYPILSVLTADGFERLSEQETEELAREIVDQRHRLPNGPVAAV